MEQKPVVAEGYVPKPEGKKNKILFVCKNNQYESHALEQFFRANWPEDEYRSAGVEQYMTKLKNKRFISDEDLDWADLIVFSMPADYAKAEEIFGQEKLLNKDSCVIGTNCGVYDRGERGKAYLLRVKEMLTRFGY